MAGLEGFSMKDVTNIHSFTCRSSKCIKKPNGWRCFCNAPNLMYARSEVLGRHLQCAQTGYCTLPHALEEFPQSRYLTCCLGVFLTMSDDTLPKTLALESSLGRMTQLLNHMVLHQSLMSLEERTSLRPAREFHSRIALEVGAHMFVAELEAKGSGQPFLDPSPKSAVPASFRSHKSLSSTSQASALAAWQTILGKVLCLRHHF